MTDEELGDGWEKIEAHILNGSLEDDDWDCTVRPDANDENNSSRCSRSLPGVTKTHRAQDQERISVDMVYRQFVLDVPRMDMIVGDKPWKGHPTLLFMDLWERLLIRDPSRSRAARVLQLCSQSELVTWFVMGQEKWIQGKDHEAHFLDGGRQRTEIHFSAEVPQTVQSITISKPFRVVDFSSDGHETPNERFRVRLTLTHDLESGTTTYAWTRKEGAKADWVFVEACAEQPLLTQ